MVEQARLGKLIEAARAQNWELVDQTLPDLADDPQVIDWAVKEGLDHSDPNVRDLGASILEKSTVALEESAIARLKEMMVTDKNRYARYRSAFALFRNGDHSGGVIDVINEALFDGDTKEIAEDYLAQIK